MRTAICYYSRHHGNTLKVLKAMAEEGDVDLIDVTLRQSVRLEEYDCIGFASGIYAFEFQKAVAAFARQYLPQGKPVFFVYTLSLIHISPFVLCSKSVEHFIGIFYYLLQSLVRSVLDKFFLCPCNKSSISI